MWREDKINLVDFYKWCKNGILEDDYLLIICLISRKADAPKFFKEIREHWSSFHDVTGSKILFIFAGDEVKGIENKDWVTYTYIDRNQHPRFREGKAIIYNSSSVIVGNKPNINYPTEITRTRIKKGHPRLKSYENFEDAHSLEIREIAEYLQIKEDKIPILNIVYLPTQQSANIKLYGNESIYEIVKMMSYEFKESTLSKFSFRDIRRIKHNYSVNKSIKGKIDTQGFKNDFKNWSQKVETNIIFEKEQDILDAIILIKDFNTATTLEDLNKSIKILKSRLPDSAKYQRMLSFTDRYLNKLFTNWSYNQKVRAAQNKRILPKKFYTRFNSYISNIEAYLNKGKLSEASNNTTSNNIELIRDINNSLKSIKEDTVKIKNQNGEILSSVEENAIITAKVNKELSQFYRDILKEVDNLDKLELNKTWNRNDFQLSLNRIIRKLELLTFNKKEEKIILNQLSSTDINIKHKLKFIIPLFFIRYEAELELNNKNKIPKNWSQWVKLFIKDTAANKG